MDITTLTNFMCALSFLLLSLSAYLVSRELVSIDGIPMSIGMYIADMTGVFLAILLIRLVWLLIEPEPFSRCDCLFSKFSWVLIALYVLSGIVFTIYKLVASLMLKDYDTAILIGAHTVSYLVIGAPIGMLVTVISSVVFPNLFYFLFLS